MHASLHQNGNKKKLEKKKKLNTYIFVAAENNLIISRTSEQILHLELNSNPRLQKF